MRVHQHSARGRKKRRGRSAKGLFCTRNPASRSTAVIDYSILVPRKNKRGRGLNKERASTKERGNALRKQDDGRLRGELTPVIITGIERNGSRRGQETRGGGGKKMVSIFECVVKKRNAGEVSLWAVTWAERRVNGSYCSEGGGGRGQTLVLRDAGESSRFASISGEKGESHDREWGVKIQ